MFRENAGKCSILEFIQVWDLALVPQHRFPDLEAEGFPQRRRHCVPDLTVIVPDGAGESEVIPENTWFKFWSNRIKGPSRVIIQCYGISNYPKPWLLAYSRTLRSLFCSGCST